MTDFGFTPSLRTTQQFDEDSVDGDQDENYDEIRKKLLFVTDTPCLKVSHSKNDTVLVFLRVRPKNNLEIGQPQCFHFSNERENELLAVAPRTSQTFKNKGTTQNRYTFTKIFEPQTTQQDLFEETLLPSLKDFFNGQNCLVFTYGVTNSGKTYTVTGTPTNPGLLPRTLDVVFNSVQDQKLLTDVKFRPKHYSEVMYLNDDELEREQQLKDTILNKARQLNQNPSPSVQVLDETDVLSEHDVSSMSTISKASSNLTDIDGMSFEMPVHDNSSVEIEGTGKEHFSIWVSFAEIYNEFIYDLLSDSPVKGKLRTNLKLQDDRNHNQFIRDLRELQVNNVDEAMLLLKFGLQNRHVAATKLNYNSSRSHSIYTIKMIRVVNSSKPHHAMVNRISIVDLAGAERSAKTGATGARVKEAGQINKSLLTLGKCIDAMKYNQLKKCGEEHVVPFRESKLTRLFQNYFVGKGGKGLRQGKITMFVNVSNTASVFDETMHVLKFSALTSKVIPLVKYLPGPTPRQPNPLKHSNIPRPTPSTIKHPNTRAHIPLLRKSSEEEVDSKVECSSSSEGQDTCVSGCSNCKVLESELVQCLNEAKTKVSSLEVQLVEQEYRIRQEVCKEFSEQLTEIEDDHSRQLEIQAVEIEEMYEKRMKNLQKSVKKQYTRKRRRQEDDDEDASEESLRTMLANLKERNQELEDELRLERNRAAAEVEDAAESYETRVVMLNQQLVEASLKFTEAQKSVSQLKQEVKDTKQTLLDSRQEMAKLSSEKVILNMEHENSDVGSKSELEKLQVEVERLRESEKERELTNSQSESELMSQVKAIKEQLSKSESSTDYALAEVEILTTRISELTREKEVVEAGKNEVEDQLREVESTITTEKLSNSDTDSMEKHTVLQDEISALRSKLSDQHTLLSTTQSELGSLRETYVQEKEAWQHQLSSLTQTQEKAVDTQFEVETLKRTCITEKENWQGELDSINQAHAEEKTSWQNELDSVNQAHAEEKTSLQSELDSINQAHAKEKTSWQNELDSVHQTHTKEKTSWQSELDSVHQTHTKEKTSWQSELDSVNQTHTKEKTSWQSELDSVNQTHTKEKTSWQNELEMIKNEVTAVSSKVAVKKEQIYKLESDKEELEKEIGALKTKLEDKVAEISSLRNEKDALSSDIKRTLLDYETTLKNQSSRIRDLERENELIVSQSEELAQQCTDFEYRLNKASAMKEALSSRVEELTNSVEDSKKALSQREAELLDTSDQCRTLLEDQIADLRKQCASLEHELTTAREDGKTLQSVLKEKENELLSLAKSVGGDKCEVSSLTSQLEELTQRTQQEQEEHEKLLKETQGNHQLEVAQLSIRVRELAEKLEAKTDEMENGSLSYEAEVEAVRTEWSKEKLAMTKQLQQTEKKLSKLSLVEVELKSLKKSSQQLKKDCEAKQKEIVKLQQMISTLEETVRSRDHLVLKAKITHETALQAVKDEWRREVEEVKSASHPLSFSNVSDPIYEELPEPPSDDPTIYDTVCDTSNSTVTSADSLCPPNVPSTVLKPVENRTSSRRSYLQAVSSHDHKESMLDLSKPRLPLLETSSQLDDESLSVGGDEQRVEIDATPLPLRKKRRKAAKKRSIQDSQGKENTISPVVKKAKYTLRNRDKRQRFPIVEEQETSSLQNFTPVSQKRSMKRFTSSIKKKVMQKEVGEVEAIATRTRRKKLRKSQISGPVELVDSPALNGRNAGRGAAQLGLKLRPVRVVL